MPKFRVLHLSDLHLSGINSGRYRTFIRPTKLLSIYNDRALEAIAEFVYMLRGELDAILISGDIAATGAESDLGRAIEFFNTPANSFSERPWLNYKRKPTIQTYTKPIIILPGNHDRYRNISGWPGNLFYSYFSSYWTVGVGGIQRCLLPNNELPVLAIICSDFSLDKIKHSSMRWKGGHWGQGKVYRNRLNELIEQTKRVANSHPSCAIIWMLHFAPKFEDHHSLMEQMKLIDSDLLTEEAEKTGVRYIFCGHTHLNRKYRIRDSNGIWILCAGTSTCIGSNNETTIHLRDIEIEDGKVVQIRSRDFIYNPEQQTFL